MRYVRVWLDGSRQHQHHAAPPDDDTTHVWQGETACGIPGELRWVTPENVDGGIACQACAARVGFAPPLEGSWPGPV